MDGQFVADNLDVLEMTKNHRKKKIIYDPLADDSGVNNSPNPGSVRSSMAVQETLAGKEATLRADVNDILGRH